MLVVTSKVYPYTDNWVNFVEVLILLDLVLIAAYFLDTGQANDNSAIFLLILPFIYLLLYFLVVVLQQCRYVYVKY